MVIAETLDTTGFKALFRTKLPNYHFVFISIYARMKKIFFNPDFLNRYMLKW